MQTVEEQEHEDEIETDEIEREKAKALRQKRPHTSDRAAPPDAEE